jgi:hypothetical protein
MTVLMRQAGLAVPGVSFPTLGSGAGSVGGLRYGGPGLEIYGAGDGIRTRDINLGKVALYQLSYSRSSAELSVCHGAGWGATAGPLAARDFLRRQWSFAKKRVDPADRERVPFPAGRM